jgi:hypothetical protein
LTGGFIELATRQGQLRHGGVAIIHGEPAQRERKEIVG